MNDDDMDMTKWTITWKFWVFLAAFLILQGALFFSSVGATTLLEAGHGVLTGKYVKYEETTDQ